MQQFQISIPKPCHQDWNQMTPEERGRFCSMCKKTVLDFSDKSDDEILDFIKSHRDETLCGRFRNDQLARPISRIELPLPVYRSRLSFINTFLLALLFCFGTALFSCSVPPPQPPVIAGEVETYITETPVKNIPEVNDQTIMGDTIVSAGYVLGGFSMPDDYITDEAKCTKGKVAVHPQVVDLPAVDIIDTVELPAFDITVSRAWSYDGMIVGALEMMELTEEDSFIDEADSASLYERQESILPVNEQTFFSSVYPNPSEGLLNIEFQPGKEQYVQLDLFDAVGNLVRNFIPRQLLQPERQTLKVDVSDQPPGIYFLRISTGDKVKTERVVIAGR